MKRDGFTPSKNTKICSDHFEEECFVYQNFTNRRMLKENAIPTKFAFSEARAIRKRTSYVFGDSVPSSSGVNAVICRNADGTSNQATQTDVGFIDVLHSLVEKNEEIENLKKTVERHFSPKDMSDKEIRALTGLDSKTFFNTFAFLKLDDDLAQNKLSSLKQYFLFMLKLRTGVTNEFLACVFKVSSSTVSRIFISVVEVIYQKLKLINIWPDRSQVNEFMPWQFKAKYPNCRVIVDCTEFKIQKPVNPREQQLTFSHYKNSNTVKVLIGIAPSGGISFISDVWCGSTSDKVMFLKSGLTALLEQGDLVLADKGFPVEKELKNIGCQLATPFYLKEKIQFSFSERVENKETSHLRVHVERAISRIKVFKYFSGNIPYQCLHNINEVLYIAAFLTNLNKPLISENPVVMQ